MNVYELVNSISDLQNISQNLAGFYALGDVGVPPASHGLTTAQMSNPDSFVGWDFSPTGAWAMPTGWTHPVLRWQLATGLPPQ